MIAVYTLHTSYDLSASTVAQLKEAQFNEARKKRLISLLPSSLQSKNVEFKTFSMSKMTTVEKIKSLFLLIRDWFLSFFSSFAQDRYYERVEQRKEGAWIVAVCEEKNADDVSYLKTVTPTNAVGYKIIQQSAPIFHISGVTV